VREGLGIRVWGSGFGAQGLRFSVWGVGLGDPGLGCTVWDLFFVFLGLWFRVCGLAFGV